MSEKVQPLFAQTIPRGAGVLLHPTSLPSTQGIGTLGDNARAFIDFLKASGFRYWQVCPLGATGFGDSPYQSFSAFAGNPYLIDTAMLCGLGHLSEKDCTPLRELPSEHVDFGLLYQAMWLVLAQAYANYKRDPRTTEEAYGSFQDFKTSQRAWLEPYSCFRAIKNHFKDKPYRAWPSEYRTFAQAKTSPLLRSLHDTIQAHQFYQYLFFAQWKHLKDYAHSKDISIIGDIPIFVSEDSADVWSNPEIFCLDNEGSPKIQAGVPPDYFSEDGQLWGNPLYNWSVLKQQNYAWWTDRLEANLNLYDIVRLDHFRGFDSYWAVPAGAQNARKGEWLPGPGIDLFKAIHKKMPQARLIAEDLGDITPAVRALIKETGLPGMAILQFAFGDGPDNSYLPHNHIHNQVVYPGTHDNDTTLGWYRSLDQNTGDHVRRYLRINGETIAWDFIRTCYESTANLVVIPLQDLLNLGSEARMNYPGKTDGNWTWRYSESSLQALSNKSSAYLRELALLHGR
jgi:4-alpha-glucanotransferase